MNERARQAFEWSGWEDVGEPVSFPVGHSGFPECHVADDRQGCALILLEDQFARDGGRLIRVPWEVLDKARE